MSLVCTYNNAEAKIGCGGVFGLEIGKGWGSGIKRLRIDCVTWWKGYFGKCRYFGELIPRYYGRKARGLKSGVGGVVN